MHTITLDRDTYDSLMASVVQAEIALNTAPCFPVPALPGRTNSYTVVSNLSLARARVEEETEETA